MGGGGSVAASEREVGPTPVPRMMKRESHAGKLSKQEESDDQITTVPSNCSLQSLASDFSEPSQTLIFFDWDDTLFPTAVLAEFVEAGVRLPANDKRGHLLSLWRSALVDYFRTACELSDRVVILTNSKRPWVDKCVALFVPELAALLESQAGPQVIYADEGEDLLRRRLPSETFSPARFSARLSSLERQEQSMIQKRVSMAREIRAFYSNEADWKNIISIGDATYERDALQDLAFRRKGGEVRAKTLLLPTAPELSEITLRLRFSKLMLPAYVNFDGDLDLDLRAAEDPLFTIADALRIPGIKDIDFPRHAWGRSTTPDELVAISALETMEGVVQDSILFG